MAQTHDLPGGTFFHFIRIKPHTVLKHRAATQEIDEPFRRSNSHIIRLWPLNIALVAGKWYDSELDEDEALLLALDGRSDALRVVDEEGHIRGEFERPDSDAA